MNKRTKISVCVAVLVLVAVAAAYVVFVNSDYAVYSGAFRKTFNVTSMELNTTVNARMDDGTAITSTGNFKLKDMNTTPQFVNIMRIGSQTVTQFSDGQFIYTDNGETKNKIRMGQPPDARREKEDTAFSYEAYINEFSSLLDAGMIRQLNAMEPVAERYVDKITSTKIGNDRRLEVALLPQAVDELISVFLRENLTNQALAPTVNVKEVVYTTTVNANGFVSEIGFNVALDVTAPGESNAHGATVEFKINPANPGQAVSFNLPDTEGF